MINYLFTLKSEGNLSQRTKSQKIVLKKPLPYLK